MEALIGSYYLLVYITVLVAMLGVWLLQRRRAGAHAWMRKVALDLILAAAILISYWMFIEGSTDESGMILRTIDGIALYVGAALLFAGVDLFRATSSRSE